MTPRSWAALATDVLAKAMYEQQRTVTALTVLPPWDEASPGAQLGWRQWAVTQTESLITSGLAPVEAETSAEQIGEGVRGICVLHRWVTPWKRTTQ